MILIDPPNAPGHGRLWSHLASDTSYDELHVFAREIGIPERGFDRDHYDVPSERYDDVVAAGAVPVTSRELIVRCVRRAAATQAAAARRTDARTRDQAGHRPLERKDWWGIDARGAGSPALLVFWSAILDKPIWTRRDRGSLDLGEGVASSASSGPSLRAAGLAARAGRPGMQLHLEVEVRPEAAVDHAVELGATEATSSRRTTYG